MLHSAELRNGAVQKRKTCNTAPICLGGLGSALLGLHGLFGGEPVIQRVALFATTQFIELISELANHFFPVRLFIDVHDAPG